MVLTFINLRFNFFSATYYFLLYLTLSNFVLIKFGEQFFLHLISYHYLHYFPSNFHQFVTGETSTEAKSTRIAITFITFITPIAGSRLSSPLSTSRRYSKMSETSKHLFR